MKRLARISRILEVPLQSTANVVIFVIMAMVFVGVVARYVFGVAYSLLDGFAVLFFVWTCYLMIAVVSRHRQHIKVDFLTSRVPGRYRTLMLALSDISTLAFSVILGWSGIKLAVVYRELGMLSPEIYIPYWIVRLGVPLGMAFLAFFSVAHLINDILTLIKGKGEPD